MNKVKTRFPPSPTGYLHIGGARTALFNWLFAKHHGGVFLLRFEDTDRQRSRKEFVNSIKEALEWLGLYWDEGPYFQLERLELYQEYAKRLYKEGKAYYCQCPPEVLEQKRKQALAAGKKPKYDGTCRNLELGPGPGRVLRFRCPEVGTTVVEDLIRGRIAFDHQELDDFVLIRADGIPTYQFAVVIDDLTMGITHVIRGDDHLSNTPKQILLYEAIGATPPKFAHVPMILGPDGSRLSKRHGALSILAYREQGYLPHALRNYLIRLGWSYGNQEIFTLEEMIEKFDLSRISKSPAKFDPDKLLALNAYYIRQKTTERLAELIKPFLTKLEISNIDKDKVIKAIETVKARARTLSEMANMMRFYFVEEVEYEEKAAQKFLKKEIVPILERIIQELSNLEAFTEKNIELIFRNLAKEYQIKLKYVAQPVRVALTGRTVSPGLFEIMDILGKETVLKRLKKALNYVKEL